MTGCSLDSKIAPQSGASKIALEMSDPKNFVLIVLVFLKYVRKRLALERSALERLALERPTAIYTIWHTASILDCMTL